MEIGSSSWKEVIQRGAEVFDIRVGEEELNLFAIHVRELLKWNRVSNLTAITDPFEIAVKHILDSVVPVRLLPEEGSMLDVGTGGGFPGIPLKIIQPSLELTLIDASRKKINFAKHLIRQLKLCGIEVRQCRLEEAGATGQGGRDKCLQPSKTPGASATPGTADYDAVISRAAFSLDDFIHKSIAWVKPTGQIIALKGAVSPHRFNSFCKALKSTTTLQCRIFHYSLPFTDAKRSIVRLAADDIDPQDFYPASVRL